MAKVTQKCIKDIEWMRKNLLNHPLGPDYPGKVLLTADEFRKIIKDEPIAGHQRLFKRDCVEEDKLIEIGIIPQAWVKRKYLEMCDSHKRMSEKYTIKEKAKWDLTMGDTAATSHIRRCMLEIGLNPKKYLR